MKIVFMGTPEFSVPALESLYSSGIDISLVITQQDKPKGRGKKMQYTPVKQKALDLGLQVLQPNNINHESVISLLNEINPDFIIVVAYGQILRKDILELPKYHCLNIHASLLPKYRGAAPINWVLLNGERETGITIMKMEEGLDTGPMILKESFLIEDNDDAITLNHKLSQHGADLILQAVESIVHNSAEFIQQDHSKSSYAPMLYKGLGNINWEMDVKDILNKIRGLKPWPSAYTFYKGELIKIHQAQGIEKSHELPYGMITDVNKEGVIVACKSGFITIKSLQISGKRQMSTEEFIRGNNIEKGIILGREG